MNQYGRSTSKFPPLILQHEEITPSKSVKSVASKCLLQKKLLSLCFLKDEVTFEDWDMQGLQYHYVR